MLVEVAGIGRDSLHPQERGRERRIALLAALETRLKDTSLADVNISDVAATAGLGRSAFYFYFPTKQAAVTELLADMFDNQATEASALLLDRDDPRDGIAATLAMVVRDWREHRRLFLAMLDARDSDPTTRTIWAEWLARNDTFVAEVIEQYRRDGAVPAGHDATALASALNALNASLLERHLRAGEGADAARGLLATLVHIWTAAIFAEPVT